jgi:Ran GTPase-activating protein (RanGAP) involved in mRNA processing and transport
MDKQQENHSIELNDDVVSIIIKMGFDSCDFIEWYKTMSKINKQFYRIVLNIILILTQINFYNTTFITYQKTNGLEKILEKTKNITTLEFKKITCNAGVLLSLVAFLKDNTPLTTCRFNNVCQYHIRKTINKSAIVVGFLKDFLTNTTYIELDFSNMGIASDVYTISPLANYLKKNNIKLTTLDLSSNELSIWYLTSITEALVINKTLTKLNLSNNSVSTYDIARVLKYNSTLTTLILSNTGIGFLDGDGVKTIAETLKINTTLTTLVLSYNGIRSWGIIAIAKALEINNTLTTIDISYNNVGYNAAKAIAESLKTNTTLTTLMLNNTRMHSSETKAIAEALEINSTLTTLNFSYNDVGYHGAKAIAEAVKINRTLTLLDLRCCNMNDDGANAITEALETNTIIQIITI